MRPGNALERRVERLSASLKGLTTSQMAWGLSHIIPHHCIYRTRTRRAVCVDCGHEWREDRPPARCPGCGAALTVLENSRKRRFTERAYYGIVQRKEEFTVIRIFHILDDRRLGRAERDTSFAEVLQHWIDREGRDTIRAKCLAMFPYYRLCPFSIGSDMSLKRDCDRYGYRNVWYHIAPDGYYPKKYVTPEIRRNGFRGDFKDIYPEDVLCGLLKDNRFETLWKLGMYGFAGRYAGTDRERIVRHWKSIMIYHREGYDAGDEDIWLDHLDLLDHFHLDTTSPKYLFPEDLAAEHGRLAGKKREAEEREELERRREQDRKKLEVLEGKSRYFDITFNDGRIVIVVLKSLEEYKREGDMQHHCVYSNGYYGKRDSLVLSARMLDTPDIPLETVEISLKNWKILQCYGKFNRHTEHHGEVIDLVNRNMGLFRKNRKRQTPNS